MENFGLNLICCFFIAIAAFNFNPSGYAETYDVLYLYGSVKDDGTIPAPLGQEFHQMRLNDTGSRGLSSFKAAIEDADAAIMQAANARFVMVEAYDAATLLTRGFLDNYKVIIIGSTQKVFSTAERTAVGEWVNAGGGLIAWSDSAFGGDWQKVGVGNPVGRNSNNSLTTQFGMYFMRDNGAGNYAIKQWESNHYLNDMNKNEGVVFRGEGVSVVRVSPPAQLLAKLQAGGLGGAIRLHPDDGAINMNTDAAVAVAEAGQGRVIGTFDRNTFWNAGEGTRLSHVDNREYAQRLVIWAAGLDIDFCDGDTTPPWPASAQWDEQPYLSGPTSASMSAAAGIDPEDNGVWYNFIELTGHPGGNDSGWQISPAYTDAGLEPCTQYVYQVRMRDNCQNVGGDSVAVSVFTPCHPDITGNGIVDLDDFAALAARWLENDCYVSDLCDGTDLNADGSVDLKDFQVLAVSWLSESEDLFEDLCMEAENYTAMSGIQTETTLDTGGGLNIGWIHNGDWAQYSITIPVAGSYQVDFRVASGGTGGIINMLVGGSVIGSVAVPVTGKWQTWSTVSTTATFNTAGTQTLRLNFVGGSGYLYNINWFCIKFSI